MNNDSSIYTVKKDLNTHEYILTVSNGKDKVQTIFVEAYTPDKTKLKELLVFARGNKRTMAQFAKDCSDKNKCRENKTQINPPVLSRIMQENDIKRPLKAGLIQAMLNNADDKTLVTPANLMRANGLIEKKLPNEDDLSFNNYMEPAMTQDREIKPFSDRYNQVDEERAIEDIETELASKGFKFLSFPNAGSDSFTVEDGKIKDNTPNRYDLDMDLDYVASVEDKKGKKFIWGFVFDGNEPEDIGSGELIYEELYYEGYYRDMDEPEFGMADDVIEKNSKILLRVLLDPSSMKGINISFVCQNRIWYNWAVESLQDVTVDNYISVILIQGRKIVSEYTLGNKNGKHPKCLLGEFRIYDGEDRYERDADLVDGKLEYYLLPPSGY